MPDMIGVDKTCMDLYMKFSLSSLKSTSTTSSAHAGVLDPTLRLKSPLRRTSLTFTMLDLNPICTRSSPPPLSTLHGLVTSLLMELRLLRNFLLAPSEQDFSTT